MVQCGIRFLKKTYGENSHEVKSFEEIQFFNAEVAIFEGQFVNDQIYTNGLQQAILYLTEYQNDSEEEKIKLDATLNMNKQNVLLFMEGMMVSKQMLLILFYEWN